VWSLLAGFVMLVAPILLIDTPIASRLPLGALVATACGFWFTGSIVMATGLIKSNAIDRARLELPMPPSAPIYEPVPMVASLPPVPLPVLLPASPRPTKPRFTPDKKHLLGKAIEPKSVTRSKPKKPCYRSEHVSHLKGRYKPIGVYLDECVGSSIARQLRERGITAHHAHELGHRSWPDTRHLDFAACHRLILVTRDRDFIALHEAGEPHAGILFGVTVPGIHGDLYAASLEVL
jgi:hypothetical protein